MSSGKQFDVVVIGAGVVGALIARELSRYQLKVLVIDREPDVAMGATKANSAIVHGGFAEGQQHLRGRLCYLGRRAFPKLEEELQFGFRITGSLVISFDADPKRLEFLFEQGAANGLPDLRILSREELLEREPRVNPDATGALFCEGAGVCSPWDLAIAALENAVANGAELQLNAELQNAAIFNPASSKGRYRLDLHSGNGGGSESIETRFVVNAAGLGAQAIDAKIGLGNYRIHPRSGEYVVFGPGSGDLVKSVLFQLPGPMGKGVLVGPTYQNNLLVGPDAQDSGEAAAELRSTHVQRLQNILRQARNLVDGIDMKLAIRSFTGLRTVSDSDDFMVGQADPNGHPGWIRVAGIQSPGLTSAPAIAPLVVEHLKDAGLLCVLRDDFNPNRRAFPVHLSRRLSPLPFSEVAALTQLPPGNPHRVICRCEQVREADLEEACSRGIPVMTVDAIKRRTRAGMGWCQGQFCRPRVADFLSKRLGQEISSEDDAGHSGVHRVEGRELRELLKEN